MAGWPTKIRHGRTVVDGSKLSSATLTVCFDSDWRTVELLPEEVDGQPVHSLSSIAWDTAKDLVSSAELSPVPLVVPPPPEPQFESPPDDAWHTWAGHEWATDGWALMRQDSGGKGLAGKWRSPGERIDFEGLSVTFGEESAQTLTRGEAIQIRGDECHLWSPKSGLRIAIDERRMPPDLDEVKGGRYPRPVLGYRGGELVFVCMPVRRD